MKRRRLSTNRRGGKPFVGLLGGPSLAAWLAGCALSTPSDAPHHFADIGQPRGASIAASPVLAPLDAMPTPTPGYGRPPFDSSLDGARKRVDAYLAARGFTAEDAAQGGAQVIIATRMDRAGDLAAEAVCPLQALRRPDIATTQLTVRLATRPADAGTGPSVSVQARFVQVETRLLSGDLAKQTCRSRGVLEADVRRAASGG